LDDAVAEISARANTVTATIPVGDQPGGAAVDPKTDTIYTANAGDDTVSVINGHTNTVTATIPAESVASATAITVNPKTDTIYVAGIDHNTVSVISGHTNTVTATIRVG